MKPNNMPHGVVPGGAKKSQSEVREKPGVGQKAVWAGGVAKEPMSTEASMGFLPSKPRVGIASEKKKKVMGSSERREELRAEVGDGIKMNVGNEVRGSVVGRGTGVGVGMETQMGVASKVKVDVEDGEEKGKGVVGSKVRVGLVSEVRSEVRGFSGLGYEVTKGWLGGEVQAGLGSEVRVGMDNGMRASGGGEVRSDLGMSEVRSGLCSAVRVGVGSEMKGGVGSEMKGGMGSEMKGGVGSEMKGGVGSEMKGCVGSEMKGGVGSEMKGGVGSEMKDGVGSEMKGGVGSEMKGGVGSEMKGGVGSEMKGGVGSEMKGGVGSEMKGGVGSASECHRPGPRRSPLLRLSGFSDFNVPLVGEEVPVLSRPSLSPLRSPRRFSWQKPSRIHLPHRVRSISASGPSLEYDITRVRSLEVGELYRSGLCRGIGVHTPDRTPTDHFPDLSPAGRGLTNLWETDARDEGGPESVCPRTLRQESVTYEESIPVIVRRRGCTLTVRIVSVEDIEVLPREHTYNNNNKVAKALPHQPKSLSTLSLPQNHLHFPNTTISPPISPPYHQHIPTNTTSIAPVPLSHHPYHFTTTSTTFPPPIPLSHHQYHFPTTNTTSPPPLPLHHHHYQHTTTNTSPPIPPSHHHQHIPTNTTSLKPPCTSPPPPLTLSSRIHHRAATLTPPTFTSLPALIRLHFEDGLPASRCLSSMVAYNPESYYWPRVC
ncbi:hypothetical protein Pcinc_040843 [Petrolisthes cinctipes]|uniref:Uncharacterized protein n=1 Tax=Petrolisthes cinctipes TaxID=88211 RepID=A0AAE1BNT1_PETCI|nr:hypothetical protein Pcinc_040843 [Petrolisthes cinctipes]